MLQLRRIAAMGLTLGLFAHPAYATDGFASGGDLKLWCDNMDLKDVHWGLCVGSITAAHDVIMSYQNAGVGVGLVCTQMSQTRGDVVFAVIEYLNENPDHVDYSLGDAVLSALMAKFPCE